MCNRYAVGGLGGLAIIGGRNARFSAGRQVLVVIAVDQQGTSAETAGSQ